MRNDKDYVDVTLAFEYKQIKAQQQELQQKDPDGTWALVGT